MQKLGQVVKRIRVTADLGIIRQRRSRLHDEHILVYLICSGMGWNEVAVRLPKRLKLGLYEEGRTYMPDRIGAKRIRSLLYLYPDRLAWCLLMLSALAILILGVAFHSQIKRYIKANSLAGILAQAEEFRDRGEFQTADEFYRKALEIYPNSFDAVMGRVKVLRHQGRLDDVLQVLEEYVSQGPQDPAGVTQLMYLLENRGMNEEAIQACRDYLARFPDDPWVQFELAKRLLQNGRPLDAEPLLLAAAMNSSLRKDAFFQLGNAYFLEEEYEKAIATWGELRDLDNTLDSKTVLYDIGRAYEKLGEENRAIAAWEEHLEYFPRSIWAITSLEQAYDRDGDRSNHARIKVLRDSMVPETIINETLLPLVSVMGASEIDTRATLGSTLHVGIDFIFLQNLSTNDDPFEVRFQLSSEQNKTANTVDAISMPRRLAASNVWRGDWLRQNFAVTLPKNLEPGSYSLIMTVPDHRGAAVQLSRISVNED